MQFIGERDLRMFYYRHLFRLDMELLLSAELEFRNHNISGFLYNLWWSDIAKKLFLRKRSFWKGTFYSDRKWRRCTCNEVSEWIYSFEEIHGISCVSIILWIEKEYLVKINQLNKILGTDSLERVGDKYLLKVIDQDCWEKIIYFARKHNWMNETNDKWNIFHVMTKYKIFLHYTINIRKDRSQNCSNNNRWVNRWF